MANKSKQKGNRFEREIVELCKSHNITARRLQVMDLAYQDARKMLIYLQMELRFNVK